MTAGTGLVDAVALEGPERAFLIAVVTVAGLLIGSFLNVVVYRVPAGRSVVRPRSACPHCGEPIGERDNVPVVSWLLLRGRTRCCGKPISRRYPLVEAFTAAAFGGVAAWAGLSWLLPGLLYLAAISIALALIDIDVHRLPDAIVLPAYPVAAILLVPPALVAGEPGRLVRAAIAGAALYLFYFLMMLAYPAGMGFGDVKLAGVLGLYLGFFGWSYAFIGAVGGSVVGGFVAVALILTRRAGRKTLYPYGPSMILGVWLALAFAQPVADWYLGRFGLR